MFSSYRHYIYFIRFISLVFVNSIVFLISNSIYSLLVCRKAIAFSLLTFLLQSCYNCLLVPVVFLINSFGFSIDNCLLQMAVLCLSSQSVHWPYCISKGFQCDNGSSTVKEHLCLVPGLTGKALSLSPLIMMLAVQYLWIVFAKLRIFPSF